MADIIRFLSLPIAVAMGVWMFYDVKYKKFNLPQWMIAMAFGLLVFDLVFDVLWWLGGGK